MNFSSSKLKMEVVYLYAARLYTYSIFACLIWEIRPSDFVVSMSHHIVNVILNVLSYTFKYVLNYFLSDSTIPFVIYYTSSVT
jgi:hypothetical protein